MKITEEFRKSMGWLHTWAGIALAGVLFAIFWMGTLSVFDKEIDQWMIPETRSSVFDAKLDPILLDDLNSLEVEEGTVVTILPPLPRLPIAQIHYDHPGGEHIELFYRADTGERIQPTDSRAGTGFIFPFHYSLHLSWLGLGYWVVGLGSLAMLTVIVSGIFIHRKIFADFFTFRPRKKIRRSSLDLHNLSSVIALPFHILFPLTGLIIFIITYFPWSTSTVYDGDSNALFSDMFGYTSTREASGVLGGQLVSLDAHIEKAERVWTLDHGEVDATAQYISIVHHGDKSSYVEISSYFPEKSVAIDSRHIVFDVETGEVLRRFEPAPLQRASTWLEGAHWMQFEHWPLRWLFFFVGLSGCTMIVSGLIFWMQARIKKGLSDPMSVRVVRALTIGSTTGIIAATGFFLIANRIIPKDFGSTGFHRHDMEIFAFFVAWVFAFAHGAVRGKSAWKEQAWVITSFALLAVALNWITTGDHLLVTMSHGLWSIAGMDLVLLATAAAAIWAAARLNKTEQLDDLEVSSISIATKVPAE